MESTINSTTISTSPDPIRVRDVHSKLSINELEDLKKCVAGYGWLADSARRVGIHTNTLKRIIRRGYGLAETVTKIRNVLLS